MFITYMECKTIRSTPDYSRISMIDPLPHVLDHELDSDTLIMIDYDDTIFPTSFYTKDDKCLFGLEDVLIYFLTRLSGLGTLHIVTNSTSPWISISIEKYLGGDTLKKKISQIPVTYASIYANQSSNITHWKLLAFQDIISKNKPKHVIIIGEPIERAAAKLLQSSSEYTMIHTVTLEDIIVSNGVEYLTTIHELIINIVRHIIAKKPREREHTIRPLRK